MNEQERAQERRRRPGNMARLVRLEEADRSFQTKISLLMERHLA